MRSLFILFLIPFLGNTQTPELLQKPANNKSATYEEAIAFYEKLDEEHEEAKLLSYGGTDVGEPLHLFLISPDGHLSPGSVQPADQPFILLNNAIHPGEPCGVDASMRFAHDLLTSGDLEEKAGGTIIGIIPVYNVGGAKNRNCCTRVNQNGPEMYGFRGNAKNLDLNRDFIKADSKNALTFSRIFQLYEPHLFVDAHSTNGADYQHTMTLIASQKDKLNPILAEELEDEMLPALYDGMEERDDPMCPYVMTMEETPDSGLFAYMETPRYSTGYAALFNSIGFVTETHMLKPYEERVKSTEAFFWTLLQYARENGEELVERKKRADAAVAEKDTFALRWEMDSTEVDSIPFRGYAAEMRKSKVTGQEVRYYDRDEPWERRIPYFDSYKATVKREKPDAYVIPQAWSDVIDRFHRNGIEMRRLKKDTNMAVTSYYLRDVRTIDRPYEGHFLHRKVRVEEKEQERTFYEGDVLVPTGTPKDRFIVETLEPEGVDSYFAWNFFDEVLMQKEYFSNYLFDPKAEKILEEDPELKEAFEEKRKDHPEFADDQRAQLRFIYRRSEHYEDTHRRYPVARVEG